MTAAVKVHCFSWSTGVSLELPRDYTKVVEDDSSVMYAAIDADAVWPVADTRVSRHQVRSMGRPVETSATARRQAAHALADGFAALDGQVLRRDEREVDGIPVATVVLRSPDGGWLHLTAAVTVDRLLSLAGTTYDETQLTAYDEAVSSARFVGPSDDESVDADGWVSLTSLDLRVSLRVPAGWEGQAESEHQVRLFSDAGDEAYRPTLSIEQGEPEEPGTEWFDWFTLALMEPLSEETPGFELVDSDRFRLSSGIADVYLVAFRRTPEPGAPGEVPPTSQLQAWVWAGDHRMYVVGASTRREREAEDLATFEQVVRSLRLLPPPRTS